MILSSYISNCILYSSLLHHKIYFLSFVAFIVHTLLYLKRIKKLNEADEFASEIWYTTEFLVVSVDGLEIQKTEGAELGFPDVKTCDGIELVLSKYSNDGTIHGKFEGLLLGDFLV